MKTHTKCLFVSRLSQQIVDLSGNSHVLFTLSKDLRLAEKRTVAPFYHIYTLEYINEH